MKCSQETSHQKKQKVKRKRKKLRYNRERETERETEKAGTTTRWGELDGESKRIREKWGKT